MGDWTGCPVHELTIGCNNNVDAFYQDTHKRFILKDSSDVLKPRGMFFSTKRADTLSKKPTFISSFKLLSRSGF